MQKISIGQATEGMILAKPITNQKGITLCGEGTRLTSGLIRRLSDMEITRIVVEGHPVGNGTEEISPQAFHEILEERFRYVTHQPVLMAIKEAIWMKMKGQE